MEIPIAYISFPEISLHPHYGHKLRGYIGTLFKEKSPLLHNHLESGRLRYAYPLVQYKIVKGTPMLVGIGEGADLLLDLFLSIKELDLEDRKFRIYAKNIRKSNFTPGISSVLIEYRFELPWMALNQSNFVKYNSLLPGRERTEFLNRILIGNILSFYKGIGFRASSQIYASVDVEERISAFKNRKMTVLAGGFVTNAVLPELIGIGKAVTRGFGTLSLTHPKPLS